MTDTYRALQCHEKYSELSLLINEKPHARPIRASHQRQRGMTLIVGLILLAMLMVITTIGFRNTTLSERMTGNSFDRNTSFQSAENAGKEALQVIEGVGFPLANPSGYYSTPLHRWRQYQVLDSGCGYDYHSVRDYHAL